MGERLKTGSPTSTPSAHTAVDLNDVDVFCRVVERLGFSRAARDLGVPASTVSRRVARLEERLGTRLLQRTTRKLSLTDAGRAYFEQASRALSELSHAEVALQALEGTPRGRVRLTTVTEPFVEELLIRFLEKYPEVTLEVDQSHHRVDLIAEGFDLAVRAGELPDSSLVAHRLMLTGPVLVCAPSYLEGRGAPKLISDLRDHDCVIVGESAVGASWNLRGPKGDVRVAVSGRLAVNSLGAAVSACDRGLGIGLFPRHFIAGYLREGRLVEVLEGAAPSPGGLFLVYPSRKLVAPAVRALIEHIKEEFPHAAEEMRDHLLARSLRGVDSSR